jgi:hypothetical protein
LLPYEFIGSKISSREQEEKYPNYRDEAAQMKWEAGFRGQDFLFFPCDL